ncbi:MAG: hypothetical protein AB7Q23_03995 [Hyphomonadaceae bacterium]
MDHTRENHPHDHEDRRVVEREVIVERPKKKGGLGWGTLFGVVLLAGAILAFAYSQGSFQQAGVEADQAAAQVEQQTDRAVDATQDALQSAQAENESRDAATN